MTVHGAKGLEAPIVILPDASDPPRQASRKQPIQEIGEGYVFCSGTSKGLAFADDLYEAQSKLEQQEYLRRLYVALTRAETELIICGYERGVTTKLTTWYDEVQAALERLTEGDDAASCKTPFGEGLSYGIRAKDVSQQRQMAVDKAIELPVFLTEKAAASVIGPRRVTPSHMVAGLEADTPIDSGEAPVRSPLIETADRFRRGILIHKLLEFLPDVDVDKQESVATKFLITHEDLTDAQRHDIIETVFNVLRHADYGDFFGHSPSVVSRAEVSISGTSKKLPKDMVVSGQIDRLCVYSDRVLILDYKSNRPPPKTEEEVAPLYMMQMATYAALMQEAYPDHKIECALLWTDGPRLMRLSETSMSAALTRINRLPTYSE